MFKEAKEGDPGALGELEAIERWLGEGKKVDVLKETQNKTINGKPVKNPDYRVNGEIIEIKTRNEALDDRYVKDQISKANKQIKRSSLDETGALEIQLKGSAADSATFDNIERQVK